MLQSKFSSGFVSVLWAWCYGLMFGTCFLIACLLLDNTTAFILFAIAQIIFIVVLLILVLIAASIANRTRGTAQRRLAKDIESHYYILLSQPRNIGVTLTTVKGQ